MPLRRTSKLMDNLWITMKNTMRWQITSSALNTFVGSLETAYGYAQDLNESLTNIRIVTERSTEDMINFAKQANEAAKALSTTTVDYTDAALIYYQQGLTDQEVIGRTETTIKMANAAGISAEEASDQLTAIWNNFYDGSKSLEYYADVMVRLGADTASSSEEIAEGMQQFVAVADTVGLSYEYAASALATVTATTRESANTVGTAFRTLFARIQGLNLGETLDDGTTLNKYSQALESVGISIFNVNGQIKNMDDILDELGQKWDTMSNAQQIALAQTVAGVRQYTRLIALMDNWDFFQQNLQSAYGAEGSLEEQAEIYAESWEAARDRVTAAAEDIYDSVVNPDLFITADNILTPILTGIADITDGMGGLVGILTTVGFLTTQIYGDKMAQSIRNIAANIKSLENSDQQRVLRLKEEAAQLAVIKREQQEIARSRGTTSSTSLEYQRLETQKQIISLEHEAAEYARNLTDRQKEILNAQIQRIKNDQQILQLIIAQNNESIKSAKNYEDILSSLTKNDNWRNLFAKGQQRDSHGRFTSQKSVRPEFQAISSELNAILTNPEIKNSQNALRALMDALRAASEEQSKFNGIQQEFNANNRTVTTEIMNLVAQLGILDDKLNTLNDDDKISFTANWLESGDFDIAAQELANKLDATKAAILGLTGDSVKAKNAVDGLGEAYLDAAISSQAFKEQTDQVNTKTEKVLQSFEDGSLKVRDYADNMVLAAESIFSLGMIIESMANLSEVFTSEDLTAGEKTIRVLTSMGMIIPNLITGYNTLTNIIGASTKAMNLLTAAGVSAQAASGGLLAIFSLLTVGITVAVTAINAYHEATLAAAQVSIDAANAQKEEADANRELLQQTQNALATYKESGDNKEELDNLTRQLAEAYDLEGSALARLSGEYGDYESVLKSAQKAQRKELEETLRAQEQALNAYNTKILETARAGVGHVYSGGNYEGSFTGFNDFWDGTEENDVSNYLLDNVDALYSSWNDNFIGGRRNLAFSINPDNPQELIDFYDQLDQAINELNSSMTASELGASGIYNAAVEWRDKMSEVVSEYKETEDSVNAIKAALGEFNNQTIDEQNISSLSQYKTWVDEVTTALTDMEYEGEEISNIIDNIVSSSTNPDLSGFKEIYDAILEVEELVNDDELKNNLDTIFTSDNYDSAVLGILNWGALTQETFQDAYDSAKKYTDAISSAQSAIESLTAAQSALDTLGDGDLDQEGLETLSTAIDWGNQEQEIIEFNQFLSMTLVEQRNYLQRIINDSYQAVNDGLIDQISEAEQRIAEQQDILEQYSASELEQAEDIVYAWKQVQEAYNDYQGSLSGGEEFNLENYNIDWDLLGENFDWESFKNKTGEEVASAFEYGTKEAQEKIDTVNLAEKLIGSLQEDIDSSKTQLQINAELNFENQLTQIENSVDGIVSVFDAISDGVTQTTNSAGEQVWSFSREAAKAIESIYPGFIANAELLRDGTFALTDDMYQAFLNSSQGQLAVDADTKSQMLQNIITMLEQKRDEAQASLEIADQLAKGEITIDELNDEQKRALLAGYVNAQSIANGEMLDDQVDSLTAQDQNQQTLWTNVSEYSDQGARNMSTNVEMNTQNVLANLEKIRDAAYATGIQVSQIGTDNVTKQDFDTSAVPFTSSGATTIDTSNPDDFLDSITANLDTEPITAEDLYVYGNANEALKAKQSQAVGEALSAIYQGSIDAYNEAIASAKIAQSKLLDSIDEAIEGARSAADAGGSSGDNAGTVYDTEDEKTLKDIEDRYHEINREIEDQNSLLEDIGNRIDRTYGTKRLEEYQKELEALEDQQENYNQKLAEAQAYLEQDKTNLQNLFGGTIIFKENGEIVNYQQVLQSIIDDYNNSFLKDYNAFLVTFSALTKEEQEARQAEYDSWQIQKTIAEELYQARLDALSQYEDTLDVIQEINDSIEDTAREIADNRLNQIEHRLEVVITVKDMRDAVRDLTKDIVESFGDMLTHGIEAAELSWEQAQADMGMLSEYQTTLKQYQDELANAIDATDIDRIIGNLENLQGQAISTAEALLSWIESLETLLPDALADASDRFAQFTDQLEHNESVLGLIEELYALQGVTYKTQEGFEQLQRVGQETLEAQVGQAQLQRVWYENSKQALIEAEEALAGVSEEDAAYDTLKNNRDALLAEYNEAQEAMLQAAQAAMETAQEMYTQAIEKAVYDFGQAVSGGTGLDLLQDKFDHYIDTEGRYLDKVNEAYEVASWYNKLQTDIDKTTNSKMKEQLKALQEEIDIRRENNTLSEYDLKILEAKYNVLQAQMALEDAQNAKNQMRLVRDRQGNWNYQYTADPTQIADAQQDLLDAENEWYNIAKQQVEDVTGEIISTWQECQEAIKAIYSDMTLTDEERSAKAQEIYSYYTQKIKDLESEKQNAIKDMTEAGNESLFDLAIIAGDEISDITGITSDEIQNIIKESGMNIIDLLNADSETIKDIFGDNVELINMFDNTFAKDLANMTNNANNFEDMLSKALDEANKAFEEYNDTVAGVANDTGTNLDDLAGYIDEVSDSTDICTDAGLEAADAMWEQLDAIQELSVYYSELADSVYEYIEALRDLAQETADTVDDEVNRGDEGPSDEEDDEPSRPSSGGGGSPSSGGGGDTGGGNGIPEVGDEVIYNGGTYYHDSYGDNPAGRRGPGKKVQITNIVKGRPYPIHVYSTDSAYGWLKESQISGFDTGGYTGEFNNAKLAFLHEKELVLNQEDTEKILSAVRAVRGLSSDFISSIERALDGNALSAVGSMIARLGGNPQIASTNDTIEQRVTIERVEFPNVTSSDEITEAFRSLVDDAAQWANRRKG